MLFDELSRGETVFSEDRIYRYILRRDLGEGPQKGDSLGRVLWIMLNPSTADSEKDDPTVRKCIAFSRSWGCRHLTVCNLFAFRSPYPDDLLGADKAGIDIIGPENNSRMLAEIASAYMVVVAWGSSIPPLYVDRARQVLAWINAAHVSAHCLGVTQAHQPKHPLWVPLYTLPQPYTP